MPKYAKHSPHVVEEAVEAVKSGRMGLRKASKTYEIALTTLSNKVHGRSSIQAVPRTLLTPTEEGLLYEWLITMAQLGFGQTTDDIRIKAKAILDLRGATTDMPSMTWVYRFFERHPRLTLRTPMSLQKQRALVTWPNLQRWFNGLEKHVNDIDPSLWNDPTRWYNADESGFNFDPKQGKVIAWKGIKILYSVSSNSKAQVTVLASMSASGHYLPPLLIYPYKRIPGTEFLDGFPDALLQVSDNGWITSGIFHNWMRDSFIPATRQIQKPLILLVDGHVSHTSLIETSKICEENGVILYCLFPHASHAIQPLDQAFFRSLKAAWSSATRSRVGTSGEAVALQSFAKVFQPVWEHSRTKENAEASFRAAGIFPFCPERVLVSGKLKVSTVFRSTEKPVGTSQEEPMPAVVSEEVPMPPLPFHDDDDPSSHVFQANSLLASPESPLPVPEPSLELPLDPPTKESQEIPPEPMFEIPSDPPTQGYQEISPERIFELPSDPPTPSTVPEPSIENAAQQSTSHQLLSPISDQTSAYDDFTAKQLEAVKELTLFAFDEMGRNGFVRSLQSLTKGSQEESHEGFEKFKILMSALKSSFKEEKRSCQSKGLLTLQDILSVPDFSKKGKLKKPKKATSTMNFLLSGAEHRQAILEKELKKEKEERKKLARKTQRQENARKRRENVEMMKIQRETAKKERKQKIAEAQRIRLEKDQALWKKIEKQQVQRNTVMIDGDSDDGDKQLEIEREMEQTMREADEDDEMIEGTRGEECKGCGEKGNDGELYVACEACDSWWHTRCTKSAADLSKEELEQFDFVCDECCPNQ